ncbi:MAG: LysM peptidoglycan-binding domain-containing protein [bacterium]
MEFWKNVYARYSEREVIIHDSWDLNIVYEVVHLDSLFRGANVSTRIQWKKIEEIKKGYKAILLRLSRRGKIDLSSLRGREKRVAALFGPKVRSKQLRTAAHRIRGQTGLRERFQTGLIRSGLYLHKMREIFQEKGLPLELLVLPHVESSFNYRAYSKLGAAGLWQFTRSTGRRFMIINYNVDQRLDPVVATRAAARLLKQNHQTLGSWPLAITAYNHGRNGMVRAKRKFGTDIGKIARYYRSRSFGFASRNFYSEFLAALHVATNYTKYFGGLQFYQPKEYVKYKIPDYITVKALLKKLGLDAETFAEYNPALRSPVLKSRRRIPKNYVIRLPREAGVDLATRYAQISPELKHDRQVTPEWHRVRPGENLTQIARRYRVPLSDLMAANNIRNAHRIYAGQNLQIPFGTRVTSVRKVHQKTAPKETQLAEADLKKEEKPSLMDVPPTVRLETLEETGTAEVSGTSLAESDEVSYLPSKSQMREAPAPAQRGELSMVLVTEMASRSESVEDIMEMALPDHYVELTQDMDIRVVVAPKVETIHESFRDIDMPLNGQVVVEPDETLGHFADWLSVPTHKLRRINRMSYGTPIRIGQPLWLTFENVTPEEFHRRRVEYHQGIEEDFYRNFTVEGEAVYKVKPGDNIWLICNRNFEMPHWLLKKHNPDRDLSNLVAGEEIIIPIVEARFPEDVLNN